MTQYRIVEEVRGRIKWLDDAIADYNSHITSSRSCRDFKAVDRWNDRRREAVIERDVLVSMLRGAGLKVYMDN